MAVTVTSTQLRKAAAEAQTGEALACLMTISAENMTTVRVTDCNIETFGFQQVTGYPVQGLTSKGQRFLFCPFTWVLPDVTAGESANVKVSVDNIDRELVQALRETQIAPFFDMRVVLVSQPDVTEYEFKNLRMTSVDGTILMIEGTLTVNTFLYNKFPKNAFNPSRFIGLFG